MVAQSPVDYAASVGQSCMFCGDRSHRKFNCPVRQRVCCKCGREGHFVKKCRMERKSDRTAAPIQENDSDERQSIATLFSAAGKLDQEKVNVLILINGCVAKGLIDTGAQNNHMNFDFCQSAGLPLSDSSSCSKVDLAVKGSSVQAKGLCTANVELFDRSYKDAEFSIMDGLLWEVILGQSF